VGSQTGTITAGATGSATFAATTANITHGAPVTITWCNSVGAAASAPTGLAASGTDVANNGSTITVDATTSAATGTYYFTAASGTATSNIVTVTVSPAASNSGGGGGPVSFTPNVETEAATSITANSAVLNGDILSDDNSSITDYGFLWGTGDGNLANKLDVGTNNQSGTFTATLSSLTAGTTYYFEAYATNAMGTSQGAVMSFTAETAPTTTIPTVPVFSDVPSTYWAYDAITSLSSQGIVSGYPDGAFKPDNPITRAEFATMLVKALGLSTAGTNGKFTDVTPDDWCHGYVNAAASANLVYGIGDSLFAPNALVTREQMAVMIANALGSKAPAVNGTELDAFSDKSDISSWAVTGMEEAVKAGIVSGMTPTTLAPLDNATRAQAAAMIFKLLTILGK
jgi:hypothetical protein